jgi:hypothetical protein
MTDIRLIPSDGVRYTVPQTIKPNRMEEELTVRFRVGNVYQNKYVNIYFDDRKVYSRKKNVMAPGEMEEIKLLKRELMKEPALKEITLKIEDW